MTSESLGAASTAGLMALLRSAAPNTSWSVESALEICSLGQAVSYNKGDIIYVHSHKPAFIHIVEIGVFQSRVTITNGRAQTTGHLHPGAMLGLAHAFAVIPFGQVHEFVADTVALVWQISSEKFKELMWRHRPIGETVVAILATRAGNLLNNLANSVLLSAEARVARCLLQSQRVPNFEAMRGNFTMTEHHLRQAQLARILGLSRQSVGTILRQFEGAGLIKMGRQRIEVVSATGLQQVVGGSSNNPLAD